MPHATFCFFFLLNPSDITPNFSLPLPHSQNQKIMLDISTRRILQSKASKQTHCMKITSPNSHTYSHLENEFNNAVKCLHAQRTNSIPTRQFPSLFHFTALENHQKIFQTFHLRCEFLLYCLFKIKNKLNFPKTFSLKTKQLTLLET